MATVHVRGSDLIQTVVSGLVNQTAVSDVKALVRAAGHGGFGIGHLD